MNARGVHSLVCATIAFVWLYSGTLHVMQPYFFVYSAASYQVLPLPVIKLFAIVIPYLQLMLGFCLLAHVWQKTALIGSFVLFVAFALAQAIAMLNGRDLSCGCFGFSTGKIDFMSLSIPLSCAAVCALGLGLDNNNQSDDADYRATTDTPMPGN